MDQRRRPAFRWILAVLWLLAAGPGVAEAQALPPLVTEEEAEFARQIALAALVQSGVPTDTEFYFVATELVRDKSSGNKKVGVTHYRYEGRTAYLSVVDLVEGRVVDQSEHPEVTIDLSLEERDLAETMARAVPEIVALQDQSPTPLAASSYSLDGWLYEDGTFSTRVAAFSFCDRCQAGTVCESPVLVVVDLEQSQAWIEGEPDTSSGDPDAVAARDLPVPKPKPSRPALATAASRVEAAAPEEKTLQRSPSSTAAGGQS